MSSNATPGGGVAVRAAVGHRSTYLPRPWYGALATCLALASCDSSTTAPRVLNPRDPAVLAIAELIMTSGDGQEAVVGDTLASPLSALVVDPNGNPIPGVPVTWTFGAGMGNATGRPDRSSQLTVTANGQGVVSVMWQLGTRAGTQAAWVEIGESSTVTSADATPASASKGSGGSNDRGRKVGFRASGRPSEPTQITLSDASLTLAVGETDTLVVAATDKYGNDVTDAAYEWTTSDAQVSQIDDRGVVTAMHEGAAVVTAQYRSVSAGASVLVEDTTTTAEPLVAGATTVQAGDGRVTLSATPPSGGVAPYSYQWHRGTSSGFTPGTGTALGGLTSLAVTDSTVKNGTTYVYRLVASDGAGGSVTYAGVSASPTAGVAPLVAGTATAEAGHGVVSLSATAPSGGVAPYSYQWHRSTSSGFTPGTGNALAGLTSLAATDSTVKNGSTYFYRLVARDGAGSSVTYARVSATPTAAGTDPAVLAGAELRVLTGDDQQGQVAALLAAPLVVVVVDASGNPLPEAPVTWKFASGGGGAPGGASQAKTVTLTADAQGRVAAAWKLGTTTGGQLSWAEIGTTSSVGSASPGQYGSVGRTVELSALATPGPAAEIVVSQTSITLEVGATVMLSATVLDQYGNEIPDAVVEWSSSDTTVVQVETSSPLPSNTSFADLGNSVGGQEGGGPVGSQLVALGSRSAPPGHHEGVAFVGRLAALPGRGDGPAFQRGRHAV